MAVLLVLYYYLAQAKKAANTAHQAKNLFAVCKAKVLFLRRRRFDCLLFGAVSLSKDCSRHVGFANNDNSDSTLRSRAFAAAATSNIGGPNFIKTTVGIRKPPTKRTNLATRMQRSRGSVVVVIAAAGP